MGVLMNILAVEMAGFLKQATTAVFVQEPMPEKEESVKEFVTRNLGEEARRSAFATGWTGKGESDPSPEPGIKLGGGVGRCL